MGSSSSTAAHMVKVYEEKSQYCDTCSEIFSKQSQLTTQIRSTHEKEKSPCISSSKMFLKSRHLELHHTPSCQNHHGPSALLCSFCGKQFKQKDALQKHKE